MKQQDSNTHNKWLSHTNNFHRVASKRAASVSLALLGIGSQLLVAYLLPLVPVAPPFPCCANLGQNLRLVSHSRRAMRSFITQSHPRAFGYIQGLRGDRCSNGWSCMAVRGTNGWWAHSQAGALWLTRGLELEHRLGNLASHKPLPDGGPVKHARPQFSNDPLVIHCLLQAEWWQVCSKRKDVVSIRRWQDGVPPAPTACRPQSISQPTTPQ